MLRRRASAYLQPDTARVLLQGSAATAVKIRKYMEVRTLMSVATGVLVGPVRMDRRTAVLCSMGGDRLLRSITFHSSARSSPPSLGSAPDHPLSRRLRGKLSSASSSASTSSSSWSAAISSRACPARMLAMSPTVGILLAVFLWTYLWGLFGAFDRRPDRHRARHLLRLSSVNPLDRGPPRRPGGEEAWPQGQAP